MTNETIKGVILGVLAAAILGFVIKVAAPLYQDLVFLHAARIYTETHQALQAPQPPAK